LYNSKTSYRVIYVTRKRSIATQLVFQALLDAPSHETYGFELAELTGLASGTIYPILRRLEEEGLLTTRWDTVQTDAQRRRRRYYELTGEGRRVANAETAARRQGLRLLAPGLAGGA